MVHNCRAEISPRPDLAIGSNIRAFFLCIVFFLTSGYYTSRYVIHMMSLCFSASLFTGYTDTGKPLSESVFYTRQPTLKKFWANMMCRISLQREPLHVPSNTQLSGYLVSLNPQPTG